MQTVVCRRSGNMKRSASRNEVFVKENCKGRPFVEDSRCQDTDLRYRNLGQSFDLWCVLRSHARIENATTAISGDERG